MTLQIARGRPRAETAEDLEQWLVRLTGCPQVSVTQVLCCHNPVHGEEPPNWFYLEADPARGLARRRCVGCGDAVATLDSEQHWTHPPTWSCLQCANSIVEVVAGLAADADGTANWLALAVRCVECGSVAGVTDLLLPGMPTGEVLDRV